MALALVRAPRWAPLILILILLPFWTSVLVRSYAWMVLLGRHGLINEALLAAGLLERPLRILNTPLATQIAMIHILLPYMILPIANALRQIDPSLPRAASGLGATPWRTFRQVILPLSMPGVAAGVLLVFVLALGFYITPAMVGGPREITLSMLIAQQVDQLNWAYAATLSAVLLATALALIAACYRLPGIGNAFRMNGGARDDRRAPPADDRRRADPAVPRLSHRRRGRGVVLVGDLPHLPAAGLRPALVRRLFRQRGLAAADLAQPLGRRRVVVLATLLGTLAALGIARLPRRCASWRPA